MMMSCLFFDYLLIFVCFWFGCLICPSHSYTTSTPPLSLEAQLAQDFPRVTKRWRKQQNYDPSDRDYFDENGGPPLYLDEPSDEELSLTQEKFAQAVEASSTRTHYYGRRRGEEPEQEELVGSDVMMPSIRGPFTAMVHLPGTHDTFHFYAHPPTLFRWSYSSPKLKYTYLVNNSGKQHGWLYKVKYNGTAEYCCKAPVIGEPMPGPKPVHWIAAPTEPKAGTCANKPVLFYNGYPSVHMPFFLFTNGTTAGAIRGTTLLLGFERAGQTPVCAKVEDLKTPIEFQFSPTPPPSNSVFHEPKECQMASSLKNCPAHILP
eukprot:TRINITY_DN55174_c0_g1_i1.p1 TRINITY_DN55174_c0_g1~~TRINITY_DN55174_c0_g1_i1.p1  ORF type:complete len:318 (+),score=31.41 TRINITY_DN55174_c0_g1_i1:44-997(+)